MNSLFPSTSLLLLKESAREAFCQLSHKEGFVFVLAIWYWVIQAGGTARAEARAVYVRPSAEESEQGNCITRSWLQLACSLWDVFSWSRESAAVVTGRCRP